MYAQGRGRAHEFHCLGRISVCFAGIDFVFVLGYEHHNCPASGQSPVAVAAPRRLDDGLQRRKGAVHGLKVQIHARFYALSCHDTAGQVD